MGVSIAKPFEFAYELLKPQTSYPKAQFQEAMDKERNGSLFMKTCTGPFNL